MDTTVKSLVPGARSSDRESLLVDVVDVFEDLCAGVAVVLEGLFDLDRMGAGEVVRDELVSVGLGVGVLFEGVGVVGDGLEELGFLEVLLVAVGVFDAPEGGVFVGLGEVLDDDALGVVAVELADDHAADEVVAVAEPVFVVLVVVVLVVVVVLGGGARFLLGDDVAAVVEAEVVEGEGDAVLEVAFRGDRVGEGGAEVFEVVAADEAGPVGLLRIGVEAGVRRRKSLAEDAGELGVRRVARDPLRRGPVVEPPVGPAEAVVAEGFPPDVEGRQLGSIVRGLLLGVGDFFQLVQVAEGVGEVLVDPRLGLAAVTVVAEEGALPAFLHEGLQFRDAARRRRPLGGVVVKARVTTTRRRCDAANQREKDLLEALQDVLALQLQGDPFVSLVLSLGVPLPRIVDLPSELEIARRLCSRLFLRELALQRGEVLVVVDLLQPRQGRHLDPVLQESRVLLLLEAPSDLRRRRRRGRFRLVVPALPLEFGQGGVLRRHLLEAVLGPRLLQRLLPRLGGLFLLDLAIVELLPHLLRRQRS
mmetsp:Transcript_20944/g.67465  ORF Transcript_20944/g.67465 Transcript_20944/m.67465 type:complete len:532 (+) Transcript_20944:246-1841(+)